MRDEGPPPEKPRQPGRIRAVLLALAVHAAFFGLIVFGVSWQNRPAPPLEAELWKDLPPVKAAKSAEPAPAPEPPPPEPAKPEPPKPEPPNPVPPKPEPAKVEPPRPDPAIAEKREREKKEQEKRDRLERERKEKLEKQKAEETRKKAEDAKKKREAEEADRKRKAEEEKARVAKAKADAEAAAVATARQAEIIQWRDRIRDKIRGRANVPDTVTGKPVIEVRITLLPGGEVLEIRMEKSSGNKIYDDAILRAIRSASPLPVPAANSELFPQFRDLRLKIDHER